MPKLYFFGSFFIWFFILYQLRCTWTLSILTARKAKQKTKRSKSFSSSLVIRRKGKSQNGCFKETKHTKFSEKTNIFYPPPWYAHVRGHIGGKKCSFLRKSGMLCFLETPVHQSLNKELCAKLVLSPLGYDVSRKLDCVLKIKVVYNQVVCGRRTKNISNINLIILLGCSQVFLTFRFTLYSTTLCTQSNIFLPRKKISWK